MAGKQQRTEAQHYVPQMLLRGFTNDAGRLHCFDKACGKSYPTSTGSAAQQSNFYEVLPHMPVNAVENALRDMESKWAPILHQFIESADAGVFTYGQKIAFARFVVIQWMRTPTFRVVGYEMMEKAGQAIIDQLVTVNFPEAKENAKPRFCIDWDKMAGVHAAKLFEAEKIARMAKDLARHIWIVGINDSEHTFYTSDHPVVRCGHIKVNGGPQIGANDPGVEFVFPLDNRHILLIRERTFFSGSNCLDQRSVRLSAADVRELNSLQVMRSNQRIYCANDDFDVARDVCLAHPEVCDPRRARVHVETTPIVDMKSQLWVNVLE